MIILNWRKSVFWVLMLLLSSCVEPYEPEVIQARNSFLVVSGFLNVNGPTTIQLSRTQNLSDQSMPIFEERASVFIEEEQGGQHRLWELGSGTYTISGLDLNVGSKYRLFIRTAAGKEYASDYVAVKQTPAIDEVSWEAGSEGLEIFVSTHDPKNDTWYYRWEYEDTWEYTSAYDTNLKFVNGEVVYREYGELGIYRCWRTEASKTIKLGTSTKLSQDVIHAYPLLSVPSNSSKLLYKYSVLVKQYALTREAYQYWETLKKNTESIGTLFDPLPSQLTGNIHSLSDPSELVVGYIAASSVQEKRLFVSNDELPKNWRGTYPTCVLDTIPVAEAPDYFETGYNMPVGEIMPPMGTVVTDYTYAKKECVDCRLFGTNIKPDFWE
ncbi:uncharacterized protein DUF4249 [Pontibacter ummariensis]|uniref:DUF4249 domain-containing protein n=2 Tax=Pontibacter ummariensis TaxID=1610492 RepID=A0A239F1J0_9BACT|nr:uncharacterized protein DUF4249 [Pontibacter ummariensis]SNS50705.1 protein of unknown function [Pontibacter ummariensis]